MLRTSFFFKEFLCTVLVLLAVSATAQVRFGVKGGLSTYDLGVNNAIQIVQGGNQFELNVKDSKYGYHLGLLLQFSMASVLIQPEIVFNSNTVDFTFDQVTTGTPGNVFSERYQNLDFPLLLGLKAGPLRLMAGPVGHYFLSSSSDLFEFENYDQQFDDFTYGWQGGIGLDLLNLMLDVRYEGNFNKFGSHIVFAGRQYAFDNNPARLLASLALTIK